jgi:hypothetical protein
VTVSEDTLVKNEEGGSEKNKEQLIVNTVNAFIPRRVGDRDEYVEFASRYTVSCRSCHSNYLSTVEDYSATERKMIEECRNKMNVADYNKTLCFTATDWKTDGCRQTADRTETGQKENND